MENNDVTGMFESYDTLFNSWSDTMNSWAKGAGDFSKAFTPGGNGNGFGFWKNLGDWDKVGTYFAEMMKDMPFSYGYMESIGDALSKGSDSYRKVYDICIRNMTHVMEEGYKIDLKLISGQGSETDTFLESLSNAYHNVTGAVVDAAKGTPFQGIKEIDNAIKTSLERFSDEQNMAKALFREVTNFNAKMVKLSTSALREACVSARGKDVISMDAYKSMMEIYGETLKHTAEIMEFPNALLPEYQEAVDSAICLAAKNLDVLASWLEISLKSNQAAGHSTDDIRKFYEGLFEDVKKGKPVSQEAFCKKWAETCEKVACDLIGGLHFNGSIPKFINVCSDCVKSANEHYRGIMVLPYVIKKDAETAIAEKPAPQSE